MFRYVKACVTSHFFVFYFRRCIIQYCVYIVTKRVISFTIIVFASVVVACLSIGNILGDNPFPFLPLSFPALFLHLPIPR